MNYLLVIELSHKEKFVLQIEQEVQQGQEVSQVEVEKKLRSNSLSLMESECNRLLINNRLHEKNTTNL